MTSILDEAAIIAADIAELRHDIHREPEIGLALPRTQGKVLDALDGLPLEITKGQELSSVTAVLRGGQARPDGAAARRHGRAAGAPRRPGCRMPRGIDGSMHACGHDLHTAMLAGAARLLPPAAQLAGNVIFMFQPGEEGMAARGT